LCRGFGLYAYPVFCIVSLCVFAAVGIRRVAREGSLVWAPCGHFG
jgi:hypothetical protein